MKGPRKSLWVSWTAKKTNEWVLYKAGVKREPLDTVKTRKLAYYGHTTRKRGSCVEKERKTTHGLGGQHQDVDRTPRGRVSQNDRGQILMEKVRPCCGHPSDRGRLKNRTVRFSQGSTFQAAAKLRRGFVVCLPLSVCYYARWDSNYDDVGAVCELLVSTRSARQRSSSCCLCLLCGRLI